MHYFLPCPVSTGCILFELVPFLGGSGQGFRGEVSVCFDDENDPPHGGRMTLVGKAMGVFSGRGPLWGTTIFYDRLGYVDR